MFASPEAQAIARRVDEELPASSLTVPDVQISRFRFFMEELRSRRCSDGRSGLPAEGDL